MKRTEELRQELEKLDRVKLNLLARALEIRGFRRKKIPELVRIIIDIYDEKRIRTSLYDLMATFELRKPTLWQRYHNHVYGVFTILGVLAGFVFYFWPSAPTVVIEKDLMPVSLEVRTIDGSGHVINTANTKLLEYVLYKEDEKRQWQYLQTTKASNEQYTSLAIAEAGIYNVEVYDFGMFLGVAADIVVKKENLKVSINVPKRRRVNVRTLSRGAVTSVSNAEIQILNDQMQDQPMLSHRTNERGEVEFLLWPIQVPQEYYLISVVVDGMEVHRSQAIRIQDKEAPEEILVTIDSGRGRATK